ncbi:porin [Paraburkholderia sp.]|uniref:porin n=1 Tax=Paraburkholderia sp. TaxID=1926495 RepID=UPI00238DBE7A|nr:porin [Paraburkholderia sp.]MDE1181537.1 porin [Paraburkholderia sp.]
MKTSISRALKTTLKASVIAGLMAGASAAFAQSSVQLYGQVDEWIGAQKLPGGHTATVVSGGGMSTSYWGLKGSEDLGGGYKAIFALEGFFLAQNGQYGRFTGDTMFSRNAYVGMESPYGTVTAGRLTTELFVSTILFNPFSDSYEFSPMIWQTYLGFGTFPSYSTDQGVTGDSGWSNAIQYSSPNFNGLSASGMYALGNTTQNGAKKWSGQVLYFHGPFAATAVYQYVNFNNTPSDLSSLALSGMPGLKSQSVAQVGVSYDLKYVKMFAQYMYTYNNQDITSWHVNTGQGGVTVPVGPGSVMASYAYSRDGGGYNQTRSTAAVGYDYPLSKRTDVYAAYMYDHISNQSSGNTYGVGLRAKF